MIRFDGSLPTDLYVACSGGVDSMAVLSFLMNGRTPKVAYFNHGTPHSQKTEVFIRDFCKANNLTLEVGHITCERNPRESKEEYWRNQRYAFLHGLNAPVVMAHNLDDCIETWIFSALNGNPKIIPYSNGNVIRPFRQTPKADFISWCVRKEIPWSEDSSNADCAYVRNRIRHKIVPEAKLVNPGLAKVIRKKIMAEFP
jgi:tRNA(Ile)-lysidine synthase